MQSSITPDQSNPNSSPESSVPRGAPAPAKDRRLDCSEAPAETDPRKPAAGRGLPPRAR